MPQELDQATLGPLKALPHQPPWPTLLVGGRTWRAPPCPQPAGHSLDACGPSLSHAPPAIFSHIISYGILGPLPGPLPVPNLDSLCPDVTAVSCFLPPSPHLPLLRISVGSHCLPKSPNSSLSRTFQPHPAPTFLSTPFPPSPPLSQGSRQLGIAPITPESLLPDRLTPFPSARKTPPQLGENPQFQGPPFLPGPALITWPGSTSLSPMASQHIRPPQTLGANSSFSSSNSQLPESSRDSTTSPNPRHPESQPPGQERCFLMGVCMAFMGLNSGSGGP